VGCPLGAVEGKALGEEVATPEGSAEGWPVGR